jgi:hypothetical protein
VSGPSSCDFLSWTLGVCWVVVCLWCPFLYWGTYPPFLLLNVRHTALRAREKKKDMLGAKMLLFLVIL